MPSEDVRDAVKVLRGFLDGENDGRGCHEALTSLEERVRACNDSAFDNTDGACAAFWRGQKDGVRGACASIQKVLDGSEGGVTQEPLQSLRERVRALTEERDGWEADTRRLLKEKREAFESGMNHASDIMPDDPEGKCSACVDFDACTYHEGFRAGQEAMQDAIRAEAARGRDDDK